MKKNSLQEQIVQYIQSKTLKEAIRKKSHKFSEWEMFALACKISPTDSVRSRFLREMLTQFQGKDVLKSIKRKLDFENDKFFEFIEDRDDCFYDIIVKEKQGHESRQACSLYADAVAYINQNINFLSDGYMEDEFVIEKRTLAFDPVSDFEKDFNGTIGYCKFNKEFDLVAAEIYSMTECDTNDETQCDDCSVRCSEGIQINYPQFLNNCDLVSYKQSQKTEYGVFFRFDDADDFSDVGYIHPLNSEYIYKKDYENLHNHHVHIEYHLVEKVGLDEVEDWIKNNYLQYKAYLESDEE